VFPFGKKGYCFPVYFVFACIGQQKKKLRVTLQVVQGASACVFSAFAIPHLLNTAMAAFGPGVFNGMQRALRKVYTHPAAEAILLTSGALHVVAGLVRNYRRSYRLSKFSSTQLHIYTGYAILAVIGAHVYYTRWFVHLDYKGLVCSLQLSPYVFPFYYIFLGSIGVIHTIVGLPKALAYVGVRSKIGNEVPRAVVLQGGVILIMGGVLAMAGVTRVNGTCTDHPYASVMRQHVPGFLMIK